MMAQSSANLPSNMTVPISHSGSLMECFGQIIDRNGVPGLWAGKQLIIDSSVFNSRILFFWPGLSSNIVRAFPNLVIMYFSQEFCKNIFLWLNGMLNTSQTFRLLLFNKYFTGYTVHPFVPIQRKDIPRGIDYLTLRQWLRDNPSIPTRVWLSKRRIAEEYDYNVWF